MDGVEGFAALADVPAGATRAALTETSRFPDSDERVGPFDDLLACTIWYYFSHPVSNCKAPLSLSG